MKSPVDRRHIFTSLLATLFIVILSSSAFALDVSGTLTSGEWTAQNGTIRVTDNITLPAGETLSISPGVRVEFAGPYHFVVNGLLQAVGDSDEPIVFTTEYDPVVDSLRWKGIRFINAARDCQLIHCNIDWAWARGDYPESNGGAIFIESSSVMVNRCTFTNNHADGDGGAMYLWFTQSEISNNVIAYNSCGNHGGGIFVSNSGAAIRNCSISFNSASGWGGGVFAGANAVPTITNTIITNNSQDALGGQLPPGDNFFSNLAKAKSSDPIVTYSCIRINGEDAYGGTGNIIGDPLYINTNVDSLDMHLAYDSPCVDAGNPSMNPGDEADARINMGAFGGTSESTNSVPWFYVYYIDEGLRLNFDSIRINSQTSVEINIENNGHYRMYINDLIFSSPAFYPDSTDTETGRVPTYKIEPIEPGERMKIAINFRPSELRVYEESVTFVTTDNIQDAQVLNLVGEGIDPVASVSDTTFNFGTVQLGRAETHDVFITNVGQSVLNITGYTLQGDEFTLDFPNTEVDPDETARVGVTFLPEYAGGYETLPTIRTNDRTISFSFRGIGAGPRLTVELDTLYQFLGYVYFDGDTISYDIPIRNDGNQLLIVDEVFLNDNDAFSVNLPDGGLQVEPTETENLSVLFHPTAASQRFESAMVIYSNWPREVTVQLAGQGMPEPGQYVFGNVSGEWAWDNGNPIDYIVLDSVCVPEQEALKIRPGVRVLFEPNAIMVVNGELKAIGSPTDSIKFMSRDNSMTDESRWRGIELNNSDETKLSYCEISNSINGIVVRESSPTIQFSSIFNNGIRNLDEITTDGGGIFMENAGASVIGCEVFENNAVHGGGFYVLNSKPRITNCSIHNNQTVQGGGIYLKYQADAWIQSNLIFANSASDMIGAIYIIDQSNPQIINNTIADNIGGAIYSGVLSIPILQNNVIWNNGGESIQIGQNANALVSYCDVEGGFRGATNLDVDPGFVNSSDGVRDYHLVSDPASPLIDAGNPESSNRDYFFPPSLGTVRNDIGAFGGPLGGGWETPEMSIAVFQNPGFPHWLDAFIVMDEVPAEAPACSIGVENQELTAIQLTALEAPGLYQSKWNAESNTTYFITVDANMPNGTHQKIGRTFDVMFIDSNAGGVIRLNGVDGYLTIRENSSKNALCLIAESDRGANAIENLSAITSVFSVRGIESELREEARIEVNIPNDGFSSDQLEHLAIYRIDGDKCQVLPGNYKDGKVTGYTKLGGSFVVAFGEDVREQQVIKTPNEFDLLETYPNPFNSTLHIAFNLENAGNVRLNIYDLNGRQVARLLEGEFGVGRHQTAWRGVGDNGAELPSGLYWARLETSNKTSVVKIMLLR